MKHMLLVNQNIQHIQCLLIQEQMTCLNPVLFGESKHEQCRLRNNQITLKKQFLLVNQNIQQDKCILIMKKNICMNQFLLMSHRYSKTSVS